MNIMLFIIICLSLGIFYFLLALWSSRRIKTQSDYFLAGRNLGFAQVTFTLIATTLGGGMLLGTSREAYNIGYYGILYTFGISLGLLILSMGLAAKLQSLNVATTAELFETKYGSIALKKIASLLSIMTLCGLLIAQIVAFRSLLLGLNIESEFLFLTFWALIITYTIVGGLHAVVTADTAQVIYIILVFGSIFLYCLGAEPWFFSPSSVLKQQSLFADMSISWAQIFGVVSMPALFSLIEQDLAQRFFAARTQRIATLSALTAGAFMLSFSLIPIYFGIKAKLLGLVVPEGASPLILSLAYYTNDFVLILATCGILAAITSTADSLLCAISSNLAQDFELSFLGINNKLTRSKIATFLIGSGAVLGSYLVPQNIISILIGSYELSVSCLLVPLLYSYYSKRKLHVNAAFVSIICGFFGFIMMKFFPMRLHMEFPNEVITLTLSWIGYQIGKKIR